MKKNKEKKLFIVLLFLLFIAISTKVQASNASINISPSNPKVGDTVTVTVKVNNVNTVDVTVNISGVISDTIKLVDGSMSGDAKNYSTAKTYQCNSEGTITAKISSNSNAVFKENGVGKYVDVSASASVTVLSNSDNSGNSGNLDNQEKANSNVAELKMIKTTPVDFTGFRSYKEGPYYLTVNNNITNIGIETTKLPNTNVNIKITGNNNLKEGTNKVVVSVVSEDGKNEKNYTIYVTRRPEEEEMTPNVIDENNEEANKPESLRLTAISLQNDLNLTLLPAFNSEIFEYTVEVANDLEKLELSGIPNVNGAKVIIEGNDQLDSEENIITITVKADGYEDVIYKIKVIKKAEEKQEEQALELVDPVDLDNSRATMKIIIISAVATFIIIAIIIILVLKRKKDKKRLYSSYYDYYNDYPEESEKVDLIKEMENKGSGEKETRKNIFEDDMNNSNEETPEGYTVEIEADTDVEEKPRRKRGKGKHF